MGAGATGSGWAALTDSDAGAGVGTSAVSTAGAASGVGSGWAGAASWDLRRNQPNRDFFSADSAGVFLSSLEPNMGSLHLKERPLRAWPDSLAAPEKDGVS